MKPRSDSRLFQLPADQQAQLYEWIHRIGYQKAKEHAALPPPDGFGVTTHLNSLHRFVKRYAELLREREFFDILKIARGDTDPRVINATESMAHHLAFELATSPERNLAQFKELTRWIYKLKDEEHRERFNQLAERQLALELERAGLNSTRQFSSRKESDENRSAADHHER